MSLHTSIGDEYFPEEVAKPNQLTSYYESFVLIPNLGPLLYSKLYRKLKILINQFNHASYIFDNIGVYLDKYNEVPSTPYLPYDTTKIFEENTPGIKFSIEEAYIRPTNLQPKEVYNVLNVMGKKTFENIMTTRIESTDKKKIQDYKSLLVDLTAENSVISALANDDLVFNKEEIVSNELLKSSKKKQVETMIDSFLSNVRTTEVSAVIKNTSEGLTSKILNNNSDMSKYKSQMSKVAVVAVKNFFDLYGINNPSDHIKIIESCEWAFVRKEKITIDLKKPLFRGPIQVNSVSPKSELTLTETESRISTTGTQDLVQSRDDLKEYNSITTEVKNSLGTLFDYGSNLGATMSEQGYTKDNLKSEKRTRVESALRDISQRNSKLILSSQTISTSRISEYHTEGKDPKFATSEFSFEVFSPVEVKHYLEDIGSVWCPRINNPFAALRDNLNEYYQQTYLDYIEENYVIDPQEPIPSYEDVGRVSKNTAHASNPGTYTRKVTFKLTENEVKTGYQLGEDIQLEFHQHCDWYENCYDEDDRWMKIIQTDRHGGNEWVDVTVKYKVNNVAGNDPDRTYITVSIDKYKETEAYRQEVKQYQQTVNKINPARRNAVKVQAKKYAELKRGELIRKYENNIDNLKDYAFTSLMKKMFSNNMSDEDWSYYQGIIKSCIDWNKSKMEPEPCDIDELYENEFSPYHFLNVEGVRFFLTINIGAEPIFFDTMRKVVDSNWKDLFDTVEKYIKDQRDKFNNLTEKAKQLDSYNSELILGRHLEAILSNKEFAE